MLKTLVLQKNIHLLKLQFPNTIQLKVKTKQIKAHLWFFIFGSFSRIFILLLALQSVFILGVWRLQKKQTGSLQTFRHVIVHLWLVACVIVQQSLVGCVPATCDRLCLSNESSLPPSDWLRLSDESSLPPRQAGLCYPSHSSFFSQAGRPVLSVSLLFLLPG